MTRNKNVEAYNRDDELLVSVARRWQQVILPTTMPEGIWKIRFGTIFFDGDKERTNLVCFNVSFFARRRITNAFADELMKFLVSKLDGNFIIDQHRTNTYISTPAHAHETNDHIYIVPLVIEFD